MMIKVYTGLICSLIFIQSFAQNPLNIEKKDFVVMFYNVENLFDTLDHPVKIDEEFTPQSKKKWNTERYFTKLDHISQVISGVSEDLPELIGMAEVENKAVLEDLIQTEKLKPGKYSIVHRESPGVRGIDVALLYRKKHFKPISVSSYPVIIPGEEKYPSRDILYVKGKAKKGNELHVFVNHWNSRRGGQAESDFKRVYAANIVREKVDSILAINAEAKIIIVGDMNDGPENNSLINTLKAKKEITNEGELKNLVFPYIEEKFGTYFYRGNWDILDNFVVSKGIVNAQKGFNLKSERALIYHPEFICFKNRDGVLVPSRTFGGNNYYGGYSDHFAIYAVFNLK